MNKANLVFLNKFNAWVRPGTLDEYILKEVKSAYKNLEIQPTDTILDVGANIGAFAKLAVDKGAQVYCYEPEPENFGLLELNSPRSKNFNTAVVGENAPPFVDLYVASTKNKGIHMLRPVNGRDSIKVGTTSFDVAVKASSANKIKIDAEGAEYQFMPYTFPDKVERVVMEIHFQYDPTWRQKGRAVHDSMLAQGFTALKEFKDTGKNWHTIGAYAR